MHSGEVFRLWVDSVEVMNESNLAQVSEIDLSPYKVEKSRNLNRSPKVILECSPELSADLRAPEN